MKIIEEAVQKVKKYVYVNGSGSIFGRTVYASKKSKSSELENSIFGAKVYKSKKAENGRLWDGLRKLQK